MWDPAICPRSEYQFNRSNQFESDVYISYTHALGSGTNVPRMFTGHRSPHLPALLAVCALSAGLSGCGEESDAPGENLRAGNAVVFEGRGRLQCDFTGGITPEQSAMKLTREGVDVMRSGCGGMTEVAFAAVCGGPSGELVLHEIRSVNLDAAERAGFREVTELKVPGGGQGYAWVDCATGNILP